MTAPKHPARKLSPARQKLRVAKVIALAESVFADRERAFEWLRTPDARFDNRTPLSMLAHRVREPGG